jgi:hypothetical protein
MGKHLDLIKPQANLSNRNEKSSRMSFMNALKKAERKRSHHMSGNMA